MLTHRKKSQSATPRACEAHSTYTAELGVPDRRRYRRTPPGSPTVADLVRPGDTVVTSYSTGIVVAVNESFYAAPTGQTLSHFTIVYVPADRAAKYRDCDLHWINECVAVDDRILMLFEANTDEVFVVDRADRAEAAPSRKAPPSMIPAVQIRGRERPERGAGPLRKRCPAFPFPLSGGNDHDDI